MNRKRVISLSPSCTEIVCALGCGRQMVGRSHLCDFPELIRPLPACTSPGIDAGAESREIDRQASVRRQGGQPLIDVDLEKIAALQPELILHTGLGNIKMPGAELIECRTTRMVDLWSNFQTVAEALDVADQGREVVLGLKNRLVDIIAKTCVLENKPKVVCLDWIDPLMAPGLWMPELVEFAGGQDVFGKIGKPSARLDWTALAKANPDILVIMLCGFGLARSRSEMGVVDALPKWRELSAVRNRKVFLVDASQFFSRSGPRLIESVEVLAEIVTPKEFRFGGEGKRWLRW